MEEGGGGLKFNVKFNAKFSTKFKTLNSTKLALNLSH
jgi:hypothetical protein